MPASPYGNEDYATHRPDKNVPDGPDGPDHTTPWPWRDTKIMLLLLNNAADDGR